MTLLVLVVLFSQAVFFNSSGSRIDIVSTVLGSLWLLFAAFQVWVLSVLSWRGNVAPASLDGNQASGTVVRRTRRATYHFEFQGQNLACKRTYLLQRSVRREVKVLFDPKRPQWAYVLPEIWASSETVSPTQYSPDGRWQWNGVQWVPVESVSPAAAPRDSSATASLVLGVTSWIAACGGAGVLAADPNVVGGIAWQAPSPLLALAAVITALMSFRSSAKAHRQARGLAIMGFAVGAASVLLNAAYWVFALALG
ncbi:MAG TPA: hypothetical protein VNU19_08185 [Candidatus Acidoferrum sp.]|nr:hypothetical protein [Candidatus Acidoferrum sp.]